MLLVTFEILAWCIWQKSFHFVVLQTMMLQCNPSSLGIWAKPGREKLQTALGCPLCHGTRSFLYGWRLACMDLLGLSSHTLNLENHGALPVLSVFDSLSTQHHCEIVWDVVEVSVFVVSLVVRPCKLQGFKSTIMNFLLSQIWSPELQSLINFHVLQCFRNPDDKQNSSKALIQHLQSIK